MPIAIAGSERFTTESGTLIAVQVPERHVERVLEAILAEHPLAYGDYEAVSFTSAPGVQRFRSLGMGRNRATEEVSRVACVEVRVFVAGDAEGLRRVTEAIYRVHPYEEPVIIATPALRGRHVRGMDEDNPARFWNAAPEDWVPEDWVPEVHRG